MKRIIEVENGDAELSLRYWSGRSYASKQIEFGRLGKEEGVNAQLLEFNGDIMTPTVGHWSQPDSETLAKNDGLLFDEWLDWFEGYDLFEPMVIINLGKWKY